ncbi:hypothetical protein SLW73_10290 [Glutamicibacter protophormiae]|uniref:hypothetical protein n=1 Tax=Glutamicibacter protophormiae TaxID=37930 RepID=UPI002A7F2F1E|nr:hypothetical protein [Glutamicibacter protophormiae]WPR63287.1 hypothetical protein SLW72_10295 [Glutamicibacter protophormiae]WPR66783.1 hypothetical protein SLW73_10290 [Glutamicibacter protophormiae]
MSKDYKIKISVAGTGEAGSQDAADSSAPSPMALEQLAGAAGAGTTGAAPEPMAMGQMAAGGPDAAPEPMALDELPDPDGS